MKIQDPYRTHGDKAFELADCGHWKIFRVRDAIGNHLELYRHESDEQGCEFHGIPCSNENGEIWIDTTDASDSQEAFRRLPPEAQLLVYRFLFGLALERIANLKFDLERRPRKTGSRH